MKGGWRCKLRAYKEASELLTELGQLKQVVSDQTKELQELRETLRRIEHKPEVIAAPAPEKKLTRTNAPATWGSLLADLE